MKKLFFYSLSLLLLIFIQPLDYAEESKQLTKQSTEFVDLLKKSAGVASGIGAALVAHILTEYPIVVAHEYGHYFGNKVSGGTGGQVNITCNLGDHPLAVLMPFFGYYGGGERGKNRLVMLAAGPLVGIGTSYAIMAAINGAYNFKSDSSKKEILKKALSAPLSVYTEVSDGVFHTITEQNKYTTP